MLSVILLKFMYNMFTVVKWSVFWLFMMKKAVIYQKIHLMSTNRNIMVQITISIDGKHQNNI